MADNFDNNSLYMLLGEINAKVETLLNAHQQHRAETRKDLRELHDRIDLHEKRVATVEKSHWKIAGIAAAVPVLLSIIGLVIALINMQGG